MFLMVVVCASQRGSGGVQDPELATTAAVAAVPEGRDETLVRDCPPGQELHGATLDSESGQMLGHCTIPFRVVTNEDEDIPLYNSRIRGLVVAEDATRTQLEQLLDWYYAEMKAEVMASGAPQKKVFIWVYPSERRARAGLGEWVAMVGTTGHSLPDELEPDFKLPDPSAEKPTAEEDALYDDYVQALYADPELAEKTITRRFARKRKVSVKRIEAVHLKVFTYRSGGGDVRQAPTAPTAVKAENPSISPTSSNAVDCGPKPACGGFDGGCAGDESIFEDDVEVSNCTDPKLVEGLCWVTVCDVELEDSGVSLGSYALNYQAVSGVPIPVAATKL